ncbi:MAG: hypothetical protein HOC71_13105, partial [Candidatus Latescibacteria bacterium]|nr:hypothetical protein [Candidatus Latescibacterota bacterium]
QVSLTQKCAVTPLVWSGNELDLGYMPCGTRSVVTFPLPKQKTEENLPSFPEPFTIHWKGNFVTSIEPVPEDRIRLY